MALEIPFRFEDQPLLWTVDDVLDVPRCREIIALIDANRPELANNNPMYRDQDRVLRDAPTLASLLFERLRSHLPAQLGGLRLFGFAHLLRLYRYRPGERFASHMDHWFQYDERHITLLTILVYLNDDFGAANRALPNVSNRLSYASFP